ncbi:MAG TPA: twin-arginine translocation signal domain-containing protein [Chryseosolibacter sp.]|nr:twin-arginine translocation signal domain-containing protein [Chryseosolibacter sp.]
MKTSLSRRFFLAAASAAVGSLAVLKSVWRRKPQPETARFLTRDGKLVEVPLEKLPFNRVAITKDRLVSWIWKHQKL